MARIVKVAVIGAGSAGLSAVKEIRKQTEDFVLINAGPYGTTCARVACMPSKALIEAANAYHRRKQLEPFGIRGAEQLQVEVPAVLNHVRHLRDQFVAGVIENTVALGERNLEGHARFLEPTVLQVGTERIEAERVVIATGSRPVIPREWEPFRDRLFTSEDIFELENLPGTVGVIGLGAVGVELAQAMARLGNRVTAFDAGHSVGGLTDERVNAALVEKLSEEIPLHLGVVPEPEASDSGLRIRAGDQEATVERVLMAVGRRPNVDDLGLENLGIELDQRGMPPYDPETLRVGDLPVFIAGDANGYRPLLHEASDEGRIAGYGALRSGEECFARRTPLRIAFCDPCAAVVGRSRREAQELGGVAVGDSDFKGQSRARMAGENYGRIQVYARRDTGEILGAELAVPAAEHLAHLLALAIQQELTVWDLLRLPFYHPVLEEGLRSALQDLAQRLPSKQSAAELLLCRACPEPTLC